VPATPLTLCRSFATISLFWRIQRHANLLDTTHRFHFENSAALTQAQRDRFRALQEALFDGRTVFAGFRVAHRIGKQVKALRRENLIPAVIYGVGGDPVHITCMYRPLEIALKKAGGTHLINVTVDGATHNALVREVQRDKIKRTILHVDFLRVDLTKKLRADVPLVIVGLPKLSSELQLTHNITSVEVECLPTDIPDHIEINVANLVALGDQLTVGDLDIAKNVTVISDPHEVIARIDTVVVSGGEEDLAPEATTVVAEPEVIEKGKKEEEEEEA